MSQSKCTLVLASVPMTRVIGLIPSVLGMKRRREMTVALGRDEISAGVSSTIWPLEMWPLNKKKMVGLLVSYDCRNMGLCRCVSLCIPEGQLLQFGPDFLSVEPKGVLLAHALSDIETGSHKAYDIAIQKPGQELTQDLCPVWELTGRKPACK